MAGLKEEINHQDAALQKETITWQKYQDNVENIKPWLDQAELHVAMGTSKPVNLEEAKKQLRLIQVINSLSLII